jgi:peptidyl-prolyl cis-trans isomerase B (cyclophilin B)
MPNQPRTRFVILVAIVALLAASCSGTAAVAANHGGTTTTAATGSVPDITLPPVPPSDYAGFRSQPVACGAAVPDSATPGTYSAPDDLGLDPSAPIAATIATSCGDIVISLDPAAAPATVNSFVFLATAGYFDGTVFHRILPGFVVQAGDPTATGRGGPGYTVPDELPSIGFHYGRGVVAMANAGPDTGGSQFFIVLADTGLEANYTVFGEVEDGFDTLDRIAAVPLGTNPFGERSVPLETVYIESVTIER